MVNDYYSILGVSATASINEIRAAYGRRCRDCHPDRGGSHEQMVRLNEAWQILSNPQTRARYDEARAGHGGAENRTASEQDQRQAHERAQDYPQRWADFEKWFAGVSADFARAKYGTSRGPVGLGGMRWPTSSNSVSGGIFIVVGAVIVIVAMCQTNIFATSKSKAILIGFAAMAGAWLGRAVHELIAKHMRPIESLPNSGAGATDVIRIVIGCAKCGQKLRVPKMNQPITVTCTACQHRFEHF